MSGGTSGGFSRGRRLGGSDLIARLNEMIVALIKENRKLKRQLEVMAERRSVARGAAKTPGRSKRAVAGGTKRVPRKAAPAAKRRSTPKPAAKGRPKPKPASGGRPKRKSR